MKKNHIIFSIFIIIAMFSLNNVFAQNNESKNIPKIDLDESSDKEVSERAGRRNINSKTAGYYYQSPSRRRHRVVEEPQIQEGECVGIMLECIEDKCYEEGNEDGIYAKCAAKGYSDFKDIIDQCLVVKDLKENTDYLNDCKTYKASAVEKFLNIKGDFEKNAAINSNRCKEAKEDVSKALDCYKKIAKSTASMSYECKNILNNAGSLGADVGAYVTKIFALDFNLQHDQVKNLTTNVVQAYITKYNLECDKNLSFDAVAVDMKQDSILKSGEKTYVDSLAAGLGGKTIEAIFGNKIIGGKASKYGSIEEIDTIIEVPLNFEEDTGVNYSYSRIISALERYIRTGDDDIGILENFDSDSLDTLEDHRELIKSSDGRGYSIVLTNSYNDCYFSYFKNKDLIHITQNMIENYKEFNMLSDYVINNCDSIK